MSTNVGKMQRGESFMTIVKGKTDTEGGDNGRPSVRGRCQVPLQSGKRAISYNNFRGLGHLFSKYAGKSGTRRGEEEGKVPK